MEKFNFLTIVAEVMQGMLSYEAMMASLERSIMAGEEKYLELMNKEENKIDGFIKSVTEIKELSIPEELLDLLVLRYLRSTQYLAGIKEDDIDVSQIKEGDLNYWKKAMLFKPPMQFLKVTQNKDP